MSSAVILANDDGSIHLLTGSADIGQGSETMLSQIAAEYLGIPFSC
ncbi:MAG: molybdopterin cofactor-binding domain-containing protein [Blautia marasmi]